MEESFTVQTVEFAEALALFDNWSSPSDEQIKQMRVSPGGGSVSNGYIIPDLEGIRHEELINSEEFITVIPTLVPDDTADENKILILRINNELRYILLSLYFAADSDASLFSGIVLVRNFDGSIVKGYRYQQGYVVSKLIPRNKESSKYGLYRLSNSVEPKDKNLEVITVTAKAPDPNRLGTEEMYNNGRNNYTFQENEVSLSLINDGSGSGGGAPDPEKEGKKLAALFNTKLDEAKQKYQEMLQECIYNLIDDALRGKNMQFGSITHDPNLEGNINAVFTSFGNLKIKNPSSLNSMTLKHEWFHMYQHYIYGVNVWGNLEGMAEFEQAVFYDIVVSGRGTSVSGSLQDYEDGYGSWAHSMGCNQ